MLLTLVCMKISLPHRCCLFFSMLITKEFIRPEKIETACCRDINFMYLLQGKPVPDYSTIARFVASFTSTMRLESDGPIHQIPSEER